MQKGFVLLVTLVYMQIFSLLSMQSIVSFMAFKKAQFNELAVYERRLYARRMLSAFTEIQVPLCEIQRQSSLSLTRMPILWWRQHGCHNVQGNNEYYFVRERLGIDHCATIGYQYKQQVAPVYYRNTLLQLSSVTSFSQAIIVQDTTVTPSDEVPQCGNIPRQVSLGRQSIRWL